MKEKPKVGVMFPNVSIMETHGNKGIQNSNVSMFPFPKRTETGNTVSGLEVQILRANVSMRKQAKNKVSKRECSRLKRSEHP